MTQYIQTRFKHISSKRLPHRGLLNVWLLVMNGPYFMLIVINEQIGAKDHKQLKIFPFTSIPVNKRISSATSTMRIRILYRNINLKCTYQTRGLKRLTLDTTNIQRANILYSSVKINGSNYTTNILLKVLFLFVLGSSEK